MKLFFALAALSITLIAGCGSAKMTSGSGVEDQVFPVVDKYLENSAACNWPGTLATLTGEALAEAGANLGRVKQAEKIISRKFELDPVCKYITEVTADIVRTSGDHFDRVAYTFRLKKQGNRWLIYKTAYGAYLHGQLKPSGLPAGAAEAVTAYLELPFSRKRADDASYLAGKLLQESVRSKLLPTGARTAEEQEKLQTMVKRLEVLGVSADYAVVLLNCVVVKDGRSVEEEVIADLVDVNGVWKISRIDLSKID